MYQKVFLMGNLGGDPEMRYMPSGSPVTNFSVATNRRWTDSEGNPQEQVAWWRVSCFGRLAETTNQYLKKGRLVMIEGEMNPDKSGSPRVWEGSDGVARASYEIRAFVVKFIGFGEEGEKGQDGESEEIPF